MKVGDRVRCLMDTPLGIIMRGVKKAGQHGVVTRDMHGGFYVVSLDEGGSFLFSLEELGGSSASNLITETLRDRFAMSALYGVMEYVTQLDARQIAIHAYEIADALMAERERAK